MTFPLAWVAALAACITVVPGRAASGSPRPELAVSEDHENASLERTRFTSHIVPATHPGEQLQVAVAGSGDGAEGSNVVEVSGNSREIHERWLGVQKKSDVLKYARISAVALVTLVVLVAASLLWSRLLDRKVRLRTAALMASERELRETKEWLDLTVEATGAGTLHCVPFVGPAVISPRFREMFGLGDDVVLDGFEAFLRLLHPEDRDRVRKVAARAADPAGDGLYEVEYRCVWPDGSVRWIAARGKMQFAAVEGARRAVRFALVTLDITDRRREEEALRESEEWLKLTVEATGVGTLNTVPFGPPALSPRFREILGLANDAVIDDFDSFLQLVHPDDRDKVRARTLAVLDPAVGAQGPARVLRFVRPDGSVRWINSRVMAQFAEVDGVRRAVRFAAVALDVTDRKREEDALRDSEERFHTLADNIAQLAWMADARGEISWFNRRCLEYTGASQGALQLGPFLHPDHAGRVAEKMTHSFSTGEVFEDTFPLRGEDGRYRWFLSRAVPVRDATGQVVRWLGTATDVSEQREVEEALRESEARGRAIVASLAEAVIEHDAEGRITAVNEAAEKVIGVAGGDLVGRTFLEAVQGRLLRPDGTPVPPEELPVMRALRTGSGQSDVELGWRGADGAVTWFATHAQPVRLPDGRVAGVVVSAFDVTQRRQALQRTEGHLRNMADSIPDGIVRLDRGLRVLFANEAAAAARGVPAGRLVGRTRQELGVGGLDPATAATWDRHVLEVFRTGSSARFEGDIDVFGGVHCCEARLIPERGPHGDVESVLTIARDVTERKQAERQLLASREQLRALVARLNSIREEEKAHVSRELHDEMGQLLTALRMELEVLEDRLGSSTVPDARALLERAVSASELVTKAIDSLRSVLASLRPVALDRLGLGAALRQECRRFGEWAGVPCELAAPEDLSTFGPDVDTALFRIAQEALTNVARHARASRAAVSVERRASVAVLRVRDDGCGIPAGRESAGLGIVGMRERAERLGGELVVQAEPGGGTAVEARIPLGSTREGEAAS